MKIKAGVDRGIVTGLVAIAMLAPFLLSGNYSRSLLVQIGIFAIAAISLDLVMGQMGQFSFGHAAFWGIGAYASAKVALDGSSVWLGILVATAATAIIGLVVGFIALRRTRGLELAIITLGFGVVMLIVSSAWSSFTGGPAGLGGVPPPSFFGGKLDTELSYYYLVLVALFATVYFYVRFVKSRFGRAVRSINENEALASSIGISPTKFLVLTFGLSAGMMGFAGALNVHHFRFVAPSQLALQYMIIFLIILLVGGSGAVGGPILGAVAYVWVTELLRDLSEELRFLIFGVVLLVTVLVMPQGIYPALRALLRRFSTRSSGGGGLAPAGPSLMPETPERDD
jgi:branched-chain amino acid transport system permease protein